MVTKTQIIAVAGEQELFVIREFDAPRSSVFRAFTDPEILVKFFAPFDNTMHFNYHDYRTGGRYSWCNKDKNGKTLCTFNGVIHELSGPERIIQTAEFMELPERGNVILEIIKFEELPGSKTKMTLHDVCPSVATRDAMINSGMEKGLVDIFERLDKLLRNNS
jgi:uncharacterized protein YndB with AHSA1/START domain